MAAELCEDSHEICSLTNNKADVDGGDDVPDQITKRRQNEINHRDHQ